MLLNPAQIAGVAQSVGFSKNTDTWATSVAVALAESGGRAGVVNSIGATGLWQINQPVWVQSHPLWTKQWLRNPVNNGKAAYSISHGGANWTPWATYTSGAYRLHMNAARKAIRNPTSGGFQATNASNAQNVGLASGLSGIAHLGDVLTDPETWKRVGLFIGGGILILIFIFSVTDIGKHLKKVGKKAAELAVLA
jgi:hypothetical protein